MVERNARIGRILFCIYLVLYIGFVVLNAFFAQVMELTPFAGVNLAILYGFGLILAALFLAIVYGVACRSDGAPQLAERPHLDTTNEDAP